MTPRQAFKLGFRVKCAEDGLSPDETLARINHAKLMLPAPELQKSAEGWTDQVPGLNAAASAAKWSALLGPPIAGVVGGKLLSDATGSNYDVGEAKKREELAEYQRALKAMQQLHAKQLARSLG